MRPAVLLALASLLAGLSGCAGAGAGSETAPSAAAGSAGCGLTLRAVLPVRMDSGTPVTTAWVDGQAAEMLFDTGAATSFLTPPAAQRLGLHPVAAPGKVWGIGGGETIAVAPLQSLAFGQVRIDRPHVVVAAMAATPGLQAFAPDGSLGDNLLHHYEVDLDLPHDTVRLYAGRPCAGRLPGWTAQDATVPFEPAFAHSWQVAIPATIDGQTVRAMIDSGAQSTVVGYDAALHTGLALGELTSDLHVSLTGVGPGRAGARLHRFDQLQVGGQNLTDIETAILPLPFPDIGLVLGADFLQTHKVWISYATGRVYLAHTW